MATKNLGQVAGVAVQNTPPTNIALIWYDNTPSQMCHKVYDTAKKQWVIIDQKIISLITYSEIENLARQSGLPLGKFYQITDRNNTLAVAIASTKVLYADALGNILIDDLGTNIQYHVSSSNLQIDDISGTFNETNSKLVFTFDELENDIDNDYILGKTKRNNIWRLFKFKLQNLISSEQGNAISWNKGLFLNVSKIVYDLMDKVGGFVSFETFNKTIETQNTAINNVGKENQNIIQNANKAIADGTSENAIYEKALPKELETGGEPTDIMKGNTLIQCLSKLQRYINKFKYATGIRLSKDFSSSTASGKVNNNDTVESAIAKLSKVSSSAGVLNDYADTVKGAVQSGDTVEDAFSKVENQIKDNESEVDGKLTDVMSFIPLTYFKADSEKITTSAVGSSTRFIFDGMNLEDGDFVSISIEHIALNDDMETDSYGNSCIHGVTGIIKYESDVQHFYNTVFTVWASEEKGGNMRQWFNMYISSPNTVTLRTGIARPFVTVKNASCIVFKNKQAQVSDV